MKLRILVFATTTLASCSAPQKHAQQSTPAPVGGRPAHISGVVHLDGGARPRYDLAGRRLVYALGDDGKHDVAIAALADGAVQTFASGSDDIDPTWTPDGRIVFASNRDGDYDLWLLDPASGATEQVTDFDGDEIEPTVAPIDFGFFAVHNGICGGAADGKAIDAYQKVLFTRREADSSEIWFASVHPQKTPVTSENPNTKPPELSAHATHQGRISDPTKSCSSPAFAGDGLAAVWVCDGVVEDAPAHYEQSFETALAAVKGEAPEACQGWDVDFTKCLPELERKYAAYAGKPVSSSDSGLENPSVSANQVVLVADRDGQPMFRPRFSDASWTHLDAVPGEGRNIVWSPSGDEIAFADQNGISRATTDFYLQTVRNLDRFPELFDAGESAMLQRNRFVVRPADHKEFYVLHDQLRYEQRPQFISADVAQQAFRDEFLRLLEAGEKEAATSIHALTGALMKHYADRLAHGGSPTDRYYAVLFASAWAPLEAAAGMEHPDFDDLMEMQYSPDELPADARARIAELQRPVAARLPGAIGKVWAKIPTSIRTDVRANVDRMLAHEGILETAVPGRKKPLKVDFSQFKIRGAYAENDLGAYFLAMNWLAVMPLPIDASLVELTATLKSTPIDKKTALQTWQRVDALVGAFMGRPVDATVQQVVDTLAANPKFDAKRVKKRLLELRGDIPVRDANGGDRELTVTLFPKRLGLDVTFFRALTHPRVKGRGMPTSLDVFATLGNARARTHAIDDAGAMADAYKRTLDELTKKTPDPRTDQAYYSTDLYHSWLAALVALAAPLDVPTDSLLDFARSDAWKDRQLYSALAGYTQLKHSAVLYAMQDIGVECDGETSFYVAVEEPLVPRPRGFVDPNVAFYDALANLAQATYAKLWTDPGGPSADQWADEDDSRLNAMNFARDLAEIARAEVAGKPLTDEQNSWIEYIGGQLEPLTIGMMLGSASFNSGGEGRQQRGVALVTDIHTNRQRRQALQIGIGRIFDLWVVTPAAVGETMTQGGALSFYEFTSPMSDRLTDEQWGNRIDAGELPPRPEWTKSFIEEKK